MRTSFIQRNWPMMLAALVTLVAIVLGLWLPTSREEYSGDSVRPLTDWTDSDGTFPLPHTQARVTGVSHLIYTTLPALGPEDALIFRTENLTVSVAVNHAEIYNSPRVEPHQTLGDEWHMILLPQNAAGKRVTLVSTIQYPTASNFLSAVYIGSKADFQRNLLRQALPAFLVSMMVLLMGFVFLLSDRLFASAQTARYPSPFALLCISLGIWSAVQTAVPELLWGDSALTRFLAYGVLPFSGAMVCFFLRTLPAPRLLGRVYLWLGTAELAVWVATMLGEGFGFAAYVETLPHTEWLMLLLVALFALQTPSLFQNLREHFYLLLGFVSLAAMIVADQLDALSGVYDYARHTRFGLLWGMLLVSLQNVRSLRNAMKRADEAVVMRRLAYRDALTGLANRLALVRDQEALLAQKSGCVGIVQMDVNGLKQVNDTSGHEAGDALLMRAAAAIRTAFDGDGRCYRVGGDEFVALITRNACEATYRDCVRKLSLAVRQQNIGQADRLQIAMGFAMYQPSLGDRFYDLVHIADLRMYEQKRKMKAHPPPPLPPPAPAAPQDSAAHVIAENSANNNP